ncbi:protein angel homolog 1-like [Homalodisca vitripennis]|uniref:protein angel homolog 1-like n=1 Tax=Homalodisca vitripennis TaxID=197043 RepID=UPI001EECD39C|nr:protein angel homolog 1-like [Homalodisca vitripennis]
MYRTSEFRVVDFTPIHYQRPEVGLLDRPNVGMVVKFEVRRHPGHFVVVANTHLLYNPRRMDIKLCQLTILLAETERMASCGPNKYHPVILAGDLNARADSGLISLLRNGSVDCRDVVPGHWRNVRITDRETLSVPIGLLGKYLNISDTCQYTDVVAARAQGLEDPRKNSAMGVDELDRISPRTLSPQKVLGLEELLEKLRVCSDISLGSACNATGLSQVVTSPPKNENEYRVVRNYIAPHLRSSSWCLRHPFHFMDVYQNPITGRHGSLRQGNQKQLFVKDYIFLQCELQPLIS